MQVNANDLIVWNEIDSIEGLKWNYESSMLWLKIFEMNNAVITINFIHVVTWESIWAFIIKFLNIKWIYKVFQN